MKDPMTRKGKRIALEGLCLDVPGPCGRCILELDTHGDTLEAILENAVLWGSDDDGESCCETHAGEVSDSTERLIIRLAEAEFERREREADEDAADYRADNVEVHHEN